MMHRRVRIRNPLHLQGEPSSPHGDVPPPDVEEIESLLPIHLDLECSTSIPGRESGCGQEPMEPSRINRAENG